MIPGEPMEVRFWMPRLTDEDLEALYDVATYCSERMPLFFAWVVSVVQDEQMRRVKSLTAESPLEPDFPVIRHEEWNAESLAEAITAANLMCYETWTVDIAKFWDALAYQFTQAAALRLLEQQDATRRLVSELRKRAADRRQHETPGGVDRSVSRLP